MKRVKSFALIALFMLAISGINFDAKADNPKICWFGHEGEEGTWTEGACIESSSTECALCIDISFE